MKLILDILRVLFPILLLLGSVPAQAGPIAVLTGGGVRITLYTEPCAIKAPSNLPQRATWVKGAEMFEGCFNLFSGPIVAMYFDDDTIAAIPAALFTAVEGI